MHVVPLLRSDGATLPDNVALLASLAPLKTGDSFLLAGDGAALAVDGASLANIDAALARSFRLRGQQPTFSGW